MRCAQKTEPISAGPRKRNTHGRLPITSCISPSASLGGGEHDTMARNSRSGADLNHCLILQTTLIFPHFGQTQRRNCYQSV